MKISNSKKQLARIIIENGGWREGAESAAQCVNGEISFWSNTARKDRGEDWCGHYLGRKHDIELTGAKIANWHRALISRAEYFHLYPAPDADGWIEWGGGMFAPVIGSEVVDVMYANGAIVFEVNCDSVVWENQKTPMDYKKVVAYRLHKPEISPDAKDPKPAQESMPTIEQLAADYRNAKGYADRKQKEADAAKVDAEAKLAELVAAGKALGLMLSVAAPEAKPEPEPEPELVITDWRDLQVGDEVRAVRPNGHSTDHIGELGAVSELSDDGFWSDFPSCERYYYFDRHFAKGAVVFVRRP